MSYGQIFGALAGGILNNRAARKDRKAQAEANAQNMAGFGGAPPMRPAFFGMRA